MVKHGGMAALIWALLAAGAGGAPAAPDPVKLTELRALTAEAVALQQAEAHGRVTRAYAAALRSDLRRDLAALGKAPGLAPAARQAVRDLDRRDVRGLAALRDRLVAAERAHGRAG